MLHIHWLERGRWDEEATRRPALVYALLSPLEVYTSCILCCLSTTPFVEGGLVRHRLAKAYPGRPLPSPRVSMCALLTQGRPMFSMVPPHLQSGVSSAHTGDGQNSIRVGSGPPDRSLPPGALEPSQAGAGPGIGCVTADRVRGASPLVQGHFGGTFQHNFLGGGCAHFGRLCLQAPGRGQKIKQDQLGGHKKESKHALQYITRGHQRGHLTSRWTEEC